MFVSVSQLLLASSSTLVGSIGLGMLISRCCLSIKNNGLQTPKLELSWYISLWEEVVVLKGPCGG